MPWLALTLEVDADTADAFGDALLEAGVRSVWQESTEKQHCRLAMLLDIQAEPAGIVSAAATLAGLKKTPRFSAARLEDDDWVRRSQAQFTPLRVGRLWIGASWHTPPLDAAYILRIDPGLAFGTGSHPSTRLVLGFVERVMRGGERVLDYGCGSGILAIAAAKLGAAKVDAVDIDAKAIEVTRNNARTNGVQLDAQLPEALFPGRYELVMANILSQPLIALAPLLAARTERGGRIALAGLLDTQADEVRQAYEPAFQMALGEREEPWRLLHGVRR